MIITRENIGKLIMETAFPPKNTPEVHRFFIPGWLLKELYTGKYEHLDDGVVYIMEVPKELEPAEIAEEHSPTIHLSKILPGLSLSSEGDILFKILQKYFVNKNPVSVSFADTKGMSTNFFISSFGRIIGKFGLEQFNNLVKLIDISETKKEAINNLIRKFC